MFAKYIYVVFSSTLYCKISMQANGFSTRSKRMLLTYCNWPRLSVLASERLLLLEPRNWVLRKEHGLLLYHSRYRICILSLHAEISSGCALAWWTIENNVMCSLFILRVGSRLCRRYSEAVQELSICMALAPVHEEAMLQPFVERLHLMRLAVSWGMLSSPNTPSALVWKNTHTVTGRFSITTSAGEIMQVWILSPYVTTCIQLKLKEGILVDKMHGILFPSTTPKEAHCWCTNPICTDCFSLLFKCHLQWSTATSAILSK